MVFGHKGRFMFVIAKMLKLRGAIYLHPMTKMKLHNFLGLAEAGANDILSRLSHYTDGKE